MEQKKHRIVRKKSHHKKRKKSPLNRVIRKVLFFGILTVCILTAIAVSPLFNVREIVVSGLTRYSNDAVISATNISTQKNWFKMLGFRTADWLTFSSTDSKIAIESSFPYVSSATVRLIPPGKVKIVIVERNQAFLVNNAGKYIVLNKDGICLETVEPINRPALPSIENSTIKACSPGMEIEFNEPYLLKNLKMLFDMIKTLDMSSDKKLYTYVTNVDFSKLDSAMILLDGRIRVNLGDLTKISNYKINFLREVFFNNIKTQEKGTLDFSRNENPVFKLE